MNPKTSKKSPARKILIISLIVLAVLSLVGIGTYVGRSALYCSNNPEAVEKELAPIRQKLTTMPLTLSNTRVVKNGECLTGGGILVNFTVQKQYASSEQAKKDIIANLSSAGITTPDSSQSTIYLNGEDKRGASGGDLPISQIRLSYHSDNAPDYEFKFHLTEPILCAVQGKKVLCNGEDNETALNKAFVTHPITSTEVSATL